jgi:hypothetical protein
VGTLVLTHDLDLGKEWILQLGLENPFILDEREIAKHNSSKFLHGFLDCSYSKQMVETVNVNVTYFKSSRPLFILMDMRHQTAVDTIPHERSILVYDGSFSKRIAYHPTYEVNQFVTNFRLTSKQL